MGLFDWMHTNKNEEHVKSSSHQEKDFSSFKLVTDFIYEKSGITDLDKRALTASRLQKHALKQSIYTTKEFLNKLKRSNLFYQEIINIATVNETYFLREIKELNWLVEYIKNADRKLDILSMPSSSGEETYSILLLMKWNNIPFDRVNIYGYDINSDAVNRAEGGLFNEHSLHKVDASVVNKYFTKTEENFYRISSEFRAVANFNQANLFELLNTNKRYDVVLSRNMFIYFDDKKRTTATDIIVMLLKDEGIFIKGHADQISKHLALENIHYGVYRKVLKNKMI